jgi:hypothetical protein
MSQDTKPHTCPLCGASTRERVLMQLIRIVVFIVELLHHRVL